MTLSQVLGAEAASSTVVVDGSGMSRDNRVSPRTLTRWLEKMQTSPKFAETFVDSLAEQGSGTLRKRFADAKLTSALRAKSGLLRQVRCLSGYVTGSDGHRVAFSIMLNDLARGQGELDGKEFTEDVVVAIDRWLAGQREGQ
jgi:D-alanyl-D-alanine carboxypeptidase/D-alanyl-D-alanine-endopeptidase (penicillin-binding protein 4)